MVSGVVLGQERAMTLARHTIEALYCEALLLADEVSALRERSTICDFPTDFTLHCSAIRAGAQVTVAMDWLLAARDAQGALASSLLPDFGVLPGEGAMPDQDAGARDGRLVLDAVESLTRRLGRLGRLTTGANGQCVHAAPAVHALQARLVEGLARDSRS